MEKTAKEWFKHLKEPYRSQAIKASKEQPKYIYKKKFYESLENALVDDFKWGDTEQGDVYWSKIFYSIIYNDKTYITNSTDSK